MTKLKEIINNINKQDKRIQTVPDWEELFSLFDINGYWSDDERLKGYCVKTWLCTDTWVGWIAYFLDDEFVFMTSQDTRKGDTDYEFTSKEVAEKVRTYLLSLNEDEEQQFNVLNLELEVGDKYQIEYNSQILHKTAWLGDKKVNIERKQYAYSTPQYFHTVMVRFEEETAFEVDCRELLFEYNNLE